MIRAFVIVFAAAAVGLAAFLHFHGSGGNALQIPFAYSTNEEELLLPLVEQFNKEHHEVDGQRVEIVGDGLSSGEAEAKIASRESRPVIWSPASSLWGRLLNHETDASWVADENPSLVRTPLVVAFWPPEAKALGWPRKPIGFEQILKLATSKAGWAAYGLPTFGSFKLGHTNPDFSTAGLAFVTAQYYTAAGKRTGLTVADVERHAVREQVQQVQQSIVHYGDTGSFFVDQLKAHGPGYISAVAMEEVTLLDYNRTRRKSAMPLVAVYPAEGTFYFDNPLITLHAPWVTAVQARASTVFERWLATKITPALAARYGYRPGDPSKPAAAPIDRAHLVDPAQPRTVLALPEPRVLAAIKGAWHEDRKSANVAVVVDVSGSMGDGGRLEQAQQGLRVFLRQFSARDRVGLLTFSERVNVIVPISEMSSNRPLLVQSVNQLVPGGGTAVYDATVRGVDLIAALHDQTRINAVVVLTDGDDNESRLRASQVIASLRQRSEDQEHTIRVFTIAYGSEANRNVLESIAEASGGKGYTGDPTQIEGVYRQISSFF
jgi:Ca-activated chloride channel family protein